MTLLILGLVVWTAVHVWKRIAPAHRARFGDTGKIIVAIGSVAAIGLMVLGYGAADATTYWTRTSALTGINNLLMLLGVYLYAASARARASPA